ncbi:MAG: MATE family efflux transporter [Cytophagaceae bacterium]
MKLVKSLRKEFLDIVKLSFPIILGQIGSVLMGITDTIMLGRIGKEEVAAVGVANQVYFLFTVIGMGTMAALAPMVAGSKGADNKSECGEYLRTGIELGFILSVALCFVMAVIGENFHLFGQPENITEMVKVYLRVLNVSTIPLLLFLAVKQYSDGLSFTKPAMVITIISVFLNAFLNWVFIFGNLTFPEMGIKGAAVATLFARFLMALMLVVYVFRSKLHLDYLPPLVSTFNTRPVIFKLLKMGLPAGFQLFFEVGAFAGAAIFVGWLGTNDLAAHQIVLALAALTYMISAGLSVAGSIKVGNAFGKNNQNLVLKHGASAIAAVSAFMLICAAIFVIFKQELILLFINDPSVVITASSILIIAALFQLSDGIQAVALGILRGIEDVNVPTVITLFAYWFIALPAGYLMAFQYEMGIHGIWIGLLVGLTTAAVLLSLRFYLIVSKGKMKKYNQTELA